jgi:hypothetical protein
MEHTYEAEKGQLSLFPELGIEGRWFDLPYAFANLDEVVRPFLVGYHFRPEKREQCATCALLKGLCGEV